jgi:hypothetical protein
MSEDAYYAIAVPILPGKMVSWKQFIADLKGPRNSEYKAARKRQGLKKERVWLEHTPNGDLAIVAFEGKNASKVVETFLKSSEPFDQWFGAKISEIHGLSRNDVPPQNELVLDEL